MENKNLKNLILFDSHVHIYDCYDMNRFFTMAYDNFLTISKRDFEGALFSGILLLSETARDHWFEKLAALPEVARRQGKEDWLFTKTSESCTLAARSGTRQLFIIAGRQIVTAENLEVLALCSRKTYAEGQPIDKVLDLVIEQGGIPVIPWGTGKWLGRRGKILNRLLENRPQDFFLGDNSGRPVFWTKPAHFKKARAKGVRILPGSDPLPFPGELSQVASFGAACKARMDASRPAHTLKELFRAPGTIVSSYGDLESPLRFIKNQIAMQRVKQLRDRVPQPS